MIVFSIIPSYTGKPYTASTLAYNTERLTGHTVGYRVEEVASVVLLLWKWQLRLHINGHCPH